MWSEMRKQNVQAEKVYNFLTQRKITFTQFENDKYRR